MKKFGELIRKYRETKKLPLRKVAAELDIDTSILSKIERSERFASSNQIPILSKVLGIDYKRLQIIFLTERILSEYGEEEYLEEALNQIIKTR